MLRTKQRDITAITLEYPAMEVVEKDGETKVETRSGIAQIRVEFDGTQPDKKLAPQVLDEITRLLRRPRYDLADFTWCW